MTAYTDAKSALSTLLTTGSPGSITAEALAAAIIVVADALRSDVLGGTASIAASQISDASADSRSILRAGSYAAIRMALGLVIGTDVEARNTHILKDNANATLTKGFAATSYGAGTKSSGTFTPDPANGNFQTATNGGAHTLAPPASETSMVIQYTNNGSAGAITTSGFTKKTGDAFTTTNANKFLCFVTVINSTSHLHVQALQ